MVARVLRVLLRVLMVRRARVGSAMLGVLLSMLGVRRVLISVWPWPGCLQVFERAHRGFIGLERR